MSSEAIDPSPAETPDVVLDTRELLRRVNLAIVRLRVALGRDHGDAATWDAFGMTAPEAQARRHHLRAVANLLHIERASARGRLHGTRFTSLDDQRAWLAKMEHHACPPSARAAGLRSDATLAMLRAGMLVAPR